MGSNMWNMSIVIKLVSRYYSNVEMVELNINFFDLTVCRTISKYYDYVE